jgi:hypothetical protein
MIVSPCSQLIHIPIYNTGLKVLETVREVRRCWQPARAHHAFSKQYERYDI